MSRKHERRESEEERLARIDQWYREVEEAAAQIDPEDERRREETIREIRRQAKEQMRQEMGLP
jgi:hypothetical protein